jgi:hypothetical protein
MKSLSFEWNGEFYEIYGYRGAAIGHVEKVRVGRSKQWCLVSDDLSWWRPDCLRKVANFIDSLDTKAASVPSAFTNKPSMQCGHWGYGCDCSYPQLSFSKCTDSPCWFTVTQHTSP